jgi:hypothetical protein
LVRPDGYVGAIVSSGEIEALEKYLGKAGLKQSGIEHGPEARYALVPEQCRSGS